MAISLTGALALLGVRDVRPWRNSDRSTSEEIVQATEQIGAGRLPAVTEDMLREREDLVTYMRSESRHPLKILRYTYAMPPTPTVYSSTVPFLQSTALKVWLMDPENVGIVPVTWQERRAILSRTVEKLAN